MTIREESVLVELVAFGHELRAALYREASALGGRPRETDEQKQFVLLWLVTLLFAAWDISDGVFSLAPAAVHIRSMKILARSLFEYAVRAEYYIFNATNAVEDGKKVDAFVRSIARAAKPNVDLGSMTEHERGLYMSLLEDGDDKVRHGQFRQMLETVFLRRSLSAGELNDAVQWLYRNHYAIGSGYVHGSQGLVVDMYRGEGKSIILHERSLRYTAAEVTAEAISHLLWSLHAVSLYLGRDVDSIFARFFQLKFCELIASS